jgi:hypothetical protein
MQGSEGNGSSRGRSDDNIEHGMDVEVAARLILDGLNNRSREIPVAEGVEAFALQLRLTDPEKLYAILAQEGARLAALWEQQVVGSAMVSADLQAR